MWPGTATQRRGYNGPAESKARDRESLWCVGHFKAGQLKSAGRLYVSRERTFFQAIPETTISNRVDCPQLESAGGTRRP